MDAPSFQGPLHCRCHTSRIAPGCQVSLHQKALSQSRSPAHDGRIWPLVMRNSPLTITQAQNEDI